jgi:hypothetical protein
MKRLRIAGDFSFMRSSKFDPLSAKQITGIACYTLHAKSIEFAA